MSKEFYQATYAISTACGDPSRADEILKSCLEKLTEEKIEVSVGTTSYGYIKIAAIVEAARVNICSVKWEPYKKYQTLKSLLAEMKSKDKKIEEIAAANIMEWALSCQENSKKRMKMRTKSKEEQIREIAHRIWIEEGKPDGEQWASEYNGKKKIKDIHWERAVVEWTYGSDYLRSW